MMDTVLLGRSGLHVGEEFWRLQHNTIYSYLSPQLMGSFCFMEKTRALHNPRLINGVKTILQHNRIHFDTPDNWHYPSST
jgi:hypothetical protein